MGSEGLKMHLYHCLTLSVAVLVTLHSPAESIPDRLMVPNSIDFLSDEFIDYINNLNTTWKAGRNFDKNTPLNVLRGLMGVDMELMNKSMKSLSVLTIQIDANEDIPEHFDAREKWSHCPTIGQIRDQASCGSCWAFAAVETMSDRLCIATNGKVSVELSAENLLACCYDCSPNGCSGGNPVAALNYYISDGIVSGGLYGNNETCQPYQIKPCPIELNDGYHVRKCKEVSKTPFCSHECQSEYNKTYRHDKHYGKATYNVPNDVKQIQKEIMLNGPVEAVFLAYSDLIQYKGGVYQHHTGSIISLHAVKILGWGVEQHLPYWLVANSWNVEWGDKGFFKILRGSNECFIETFIIAGLPKV